VPQIDPNAVADGQLHGVKEFDNNLSMRERMAKRFRAHDTVQVKNIDNEPIRWQWLAEDDETFEMDEDIKIVHRGRPGLWQVEPGEKDVLEGGCAYIMIEALFKKMAVKKVGIVEHPLDEREIRNFSFDDPDAQEAFIDRVFIGRMSPAAMQEAAYKQLEQASVEPTKDESESKRPAKSKAGAGVVSGIED
jgi:hypothetical protein